MDLSGVSGWVQVLLSLSAIASFAGLLLAYLKVGLSKGTIDTLKESNSALTARKEELEDESRQKDIRYERILTEIQGKLDLLTATNKILNEALSNKQSNDQILEAIKAHHREYLKNNTLFNDRYTEGQTTVGLKVDAVHSLGIKALDKLDELTLVSES